VQPQVVQEQPAQEQPVSQVDPLAQQLQMQREGTQQFLDQFGQGQRDRLAVQAAGAFNEAMRNQPIQRRLQASLMQRLGQQGQPDAMTQAELTRFGQQRGEAEAQLRNQLQQLGLLTQGGDTAEQLAKFAGQSLLGEQQIRAQGQQRGERAFQDALGLLQQRQSGRMSEAQMRQMEQQAGLAEGQLGLQAFGQAQQGALGQQRLGLQERGQMLQEELGRGRLGLETELGRGRLGLQERGQDLQEELGRGRLGLETELGRGRLGLQREQFGEQARQFDVGQDLRERQFGEQGRQFDVGQRFREEMGRGQLGLQREQFGEQARQFDATQGLRERQFGEGQRQFDVGQDLRERQFGEQGRQFDTTQDFRNRQLEAQEALNQGNLDQAAATLEENRRQFEKNLEIKERENRQARRDKMYGAGFKIAENIGFFDKVKKDGLLNTLGGIPGLGFLRGGGGGQQQGGGTILGGIDGGQQQGGISQGQMDQFQTLVGLGNDPAAVAQQMGLFGGGGQQQGGISQAQMDQFQTLVNLGNDPAAVAQQMGLSGIPGDGGGGGGGRFGALSSLARNPAIMNAAETAINFIPGGGTILGGIKMARNLQKLPGIKHLSKLQGKAVKKLGGLAKKGLGKIGKFFSDEDLKEGIMPVDDDKLLRTLLETPVSSWNYKGDDKTHIGPMAQDFAAFGTDTNEGGTRTIDVVDAFGVNFAANRALAKKIQQQQRELKEIQKPKGWFN
tara:strand:+ start:16708 stop:18894 length:2187 start_codon:yes stop_codon:yes gene_type:complete